MKFSLMILGMLVALILIACTPKKYISSEEFQILNKCKSDIECTVGQAISDPSPPPECYTKKVIEASNPKQLFASKNSAVLQSLSCFCNLTTNNCETIKKINEK